MKPIRSVVVFDTADLQAESAFWAGMLDGHVFADETFHCVIDAAGEWRIGVQLSAEGLRSWSSRLRAVIDPDLAPAVWGALQAEVFDDEPAEAPWPDDDFAFGLDVVLGGIERLVTAAAGGPS